MWNKNEDMWNKNEDMWNRNEDVGMGMRTLTC